MASNDHHRYTSKRQQSGRMKRIISEVLIAILLIAFGIGLSFFAKSFIMKKISAAVNLIPDSEAYTNWINPPITTTRSYYLFNVTNPDEIIEDPRSTVIHLKDTPAYTYRLETRKKNPQWSADKKEINYEVEKLFTRHETRFDPSSVNDAGVFVDLLRASLRTKFGAKPTAAFFSIGGNNPFYRRNALEQLEGFTSNLFETVRDQMYGPNTEKSGFVYRQNGSRLYNISIHTDAKKKGQVITFASELVQFNINNSSIYPFPIYDGLTYPSMLFDKPMLNIFNPDFCKPVLITFNQIVSSPGGIDLYEYKLKLVDYNNCTNPADPRTCTEVDRIDVSKCISTSLPENLIFLSKAHFHEASNETMQEMNIKGFTQSSDQHDSFVHFEPYSGTPFQAIFRLQMNVEATIDPMKESDIGSGFEPTMKKGVRRLLPIFWLDQEVHLSEEVINKLKKPCFYLKYGPYLITTLVTVLIILSTLMIEVKARRSARNSRYSRGPYVKTETTIQY